MAYQALYRKYRSQRFDEMVGQEVVATTLKNAIVNHQVSHAYLFSGPRGTGKTSAAKIFAKAINCPNQQAGEPDNTCEICKAITAGSLEDVIELDAASNNGVDEIREIRDKSTYVPSRASYKIYIIDEVHMLSTGAFNALLKTLEEPTENVVFILATTEFQKIPATIISRVQRLAFKTIATADIWQHLSDVLKREQVDFDEKALDVLAKSAEGGMRDALSLLDQALSFSDGSLREEDALLVTGSIANASLVSYVQALVQKDEETALSELHKIFDEGKNMLRFTEDLLAYFRDLLLDKQSEISHDRLYQWIDVTIDSFKTLRETTQKKIAAEVMTLRLVEKKEEVATVSGNPDQMQLIRELQEQVAVLQKQLSPAMQKPLTQKQQSAPVEPIKFSQQESVAPPMIGVEDLNRTSEQSVLESEAASIHHVSSSKSNNRNQVADREALVTHTSRSDLVDFLLQEARKEIKQQIEMSWQEVIDSLTSRREIALLKVTKIEAASEKKLVVSVEHESLVPALTDNQELMDKIISILNAATGFLLQISAITYEEWQLVVADFMAQRSGKSNRFKREEISGSDETSESHLITRAKELFGDKVIVTDD